MIVVTGAFGFIGSNLVRELYNQGKKDILMVDSVLRPYNNELPLECISIEEFYKYKEKHLKHGCEVIFHEGAISSTTETDWSKLFKMNVDCTWKLIYYCRDNDIPLQYASSASVYGNPSIEEWHNPNKSMNPLNLYAKSKQQIDYVSNMVINSLKPPTLLQGMRYFNVYGPNEDHKENQASPYHKFTKQFNEIGKIKLFEGSKEFYRDFISVDTVISLKLNYLENNSSGIYDIGTSDPKSFYDVAIEICKNEKYIEWIPMPSELTEHYQKYTCAIL